MKLIGLPFLVIQIVVALSSGPLDPVSRLGPADDDDNRGSISIDEVISARGFAEGEKLLQLRKRRDGDYGCSGGYCWNKCGGPIPGAGTGVAPGWCWLALKKGDGPWLKCRNDNDCRPEKRAFAGCGKGDCKACGCLWE